MRRIDPIDTPEGPAKKCKDCESVLLISDHFYVNPNTGRAGSYCRRCNSKRSVAAQRKDPARAAERRARHIAKNPNRYKEICVNSRMKLQFGIGLSEYNGMVSACGGKCEICHEEAGERLCIDHCHETGAIRGLLCKSCNLAIGHMKDDPSRLASAIEYLNTRSPTRSVGSSSPSA